MGTEIVNWEARLGAYAAEATSAEPISGTFVGLAAGRLAIAGSPVAGNKLACIVIGATHENAYYPGAFDKDNRQPPVCYAFGEDEDELKPHPQAAKPQSADCASCPQNQFGSKGKGKACKNSRRLAILPADAATSADAASGADTMYIKLPVMSVKNWVMYVNGLAASKKRPPFAVVTEVSTEPDAKSQFKVTFLHKETIEAGDTIQALIGRHEANKGEIDFPYPKPVEQKVSEKF